MSVNITDVALFTSPVTAPSDGDAANAASIVVIAQALANRTAYLNALFGAVNATVNTLGAIINSTGVTQIRTLASIAALTAIVAPVNASFALVTGLGLYQYLSASALTVDNLLVVNGPSGIGRWIHELQGVANASPGFPVIGTAGAAAGRIVASLVPNRLVGTSQYVGNAAFTTTSTTAVDITGYTLAIPSCVVGDVLRITWNVNYLTSTVHEAGINFVPVVVDGGVPTDITTGQSMQFTALAASTVPAVTQNQSSPISTSYLWVVQNSGTVTIKGQLKSPSGASVSTGAYLSIQCEQIRP